MLLGERCLFISADQDNCREQEGPEQLGDHPLDDFIIIEKRYHCEGVPVVPGGEESC